MIIFPLVFACCYFNKELYLSNEFYPTSSYFDELLVTINQSENFHCTRRCELVTVVHRQYSIDRKQK